MANETVTHHSGLSFVRETTTPRGKWISTDYFAVPDEEYGEGWITGIKAAEEMFDALKAGSKGADQFIRVLEEAVRLIDRQTDETGRRGAAVGFLQTIKEVTQAGAMYADYKAWIQQRIDDLNKTTEDLREHDSAEKADFVERMKTAKLAKHSATAESARV